MDNDKKRKVNKEGMQIAPAFNNDQLGENQGMDISIEKCPCTKEAKEKE